MADALKTCLSAALGCMAAFAAHALEPLPDPTRPPPGLLGPAPAAATVGAQEDKALVLQSVLLREGRPSSAIISGRLVEVGERIGDVRLARVSEGRAVLEGPEGQTVLHLTPAAEKKPAPAASVQRIQRKR